MESRPDPIQDPDCAPSAIAAPEDDGREHADFLHLLDATAAEREAWLAEAAARCESYARRLRTLLAEVEGDLGRIEEERRDPDLGRRIARWRLTRSLGRGSTARVSLGVEEEVAEGHPDRRAAIKLFDRVDFGSGFRKRLEREIEALRRIDHPGVVRFLADGTDDATGRPWVAMEFVDGAMPIVEWASVRAATVDERAELVRQLREALAAAHAAGVVHRDLSPGNVLVDRDGRVKIVDFGIAAVVRESIGRGGSVSASGLLLGGTPATMAPEQVEPSLGPVGPWTDEYAAAVIAFRLFAGRFPYDTSGSLASVAQAVVHVPAPAIRTLEPATPTGLAAWIDAGLVKRVDARRAAMGTPTFGQRRNGGKGSRRVRTLAVGAAVFLAAIAAWAFDSVRARGPALPGPKIEEQESEMNISKAMSGAAVAWALASGVAAVDRDVPGEYPTIQAAVDASTDGDMVRVAPGTYAPFDMGDKLIVVESTGGAAVTTIDAAGLPTSAVKFGPNSTFASTLRGFRIRTGSGTVLPASSLRGGGGCYLRSEDADAPAAATIEDCIFIGSSGGCGYGAGIFTANGNLVVRRCRFEGLSVQHLGPAIVLHPSEVRSVPGESGVHSVIEECSIAGCSSFNDGGIWIIVASRTAPLNLRLARCEFVDNSASYQAGAMIVGGPQTSVGGEVVVERCVFRNNHASLANSIGLAQFDGNQDFRLTLRGSVFADPSVAVRRVNGRISLGDTIFCSGASAVAGSYEDLGGNVWSCPPAADCDGDGMDDLYQVTLGLAADANANGVPDVCEPAPCPGDTNDSGVVNAVDISVILSAWGTDGGKFPNADANDDGTVDATDLAAVLAGWGPCP